MYVCKSRVLVVLGTLLAFTRSCSPAFFKAECISGSDHRDNTPVEVCHVSCNTDGCNEATKTSGDQTLWIYAAAIGGLIRSWNWRFTNRT